jgi:short-subunit dehydrogenase
MSWCVITGASAGLGAEFARQLAARGWNLLLVARRADRLEALKRELPAVQVECFPCDLASPADTERLARRIVEDGRVELLVNNAGFGTMGLFHETNYARQVEMAQLHVLATMRLTRAALEVMAPRNRGAVICVASVAGFLRSAGNVSYCATKGWMNDFCEGLWLEMRTSGSSVKIQSLCPGFTYTEFHDVMQSDRGAVPAWAWMSAEYVVGESLRGLDRGDLFVIPGWRYRWLVRILSRLPTSWRLRLQARSPHKRQKAED